MTILFVAAFSSIACADSKRKFDFLLRFYDLNDAAFAYQRHCLSDDGAVSQAFLRTFEFVAEELLAEAKKVNPRLDPISIKDRMQKRQESILYELDFTYMKQGCGTQAAKTASAHYERFSGLSREDVARFIDANTGAEPKLP